MRLHFEPLTVLSRASPHAHHTLWVGAAQGAGWALHGHAPGPCVGGMWGPPGRKGCACGPCTSAAWAQQVVAVHGQCMGAVHGHYAGMRHRCTSPPPPSKRIRTKAQLGKGYHSDPSPPPWFPLWGER